MTFQDQYSKEDSLRDEERLATASDLVTDTPKLLLWHLISGVMKDYGSKNFMVTLGAKKFMLNECGYLETLCAELGVDHKRISDWFIKTSATKQDPLTIALQLDNLYQSGIHESQLEH